MVLQFAIDEFPSVSSLEVLLIRQVGRSLDSSELFYEHLASIVATDVTNEEHIMRGLCESGHFKGRCRCRTYEERICRHEIASRLHNIAILP